MSLKIEKIIRKNIIKMDKEDMLFLLISKNFLGVLNYILFIIFLIVKNLLYIKLKYYFDFKFEVVFWRKLRFIGL